MKRWTVGLIPDASRNGDAALRHDSNAVRSRPRFENRLRFQRQRVDPSQACSSAIGDQDYSFGGDDAGRLLESRQSRDVRAAIMIDHVDAITSRVRDEDTPAFRIEG